MNPLDFTSHRPWPLPTGPWIMKQVWNDLVFAHWPVPLQALRALVPSALPIDTFDGQAWVGVVPFWMSDVRPRGLPALPWISTFPELNVRTYVTLGGKPGVYFFSLDAARLLAVLGARLAFHLPYFWARMTVSLDNETVRYRSFRVASTVRAAWKAEYRPTGNVFNARPGELVYWFTERYCLYAVTPRGAVLRCEIHHPFWPLQPAEARIYENSMAAAHGIRLPDGPPLLHFAKRQDVVVWAPKRIR